MASSDAGVILLAPGDDCVVVTRALGAGDAVLIDGRTVRLTQALGIGHKLARRAISPGEKVLKYGAPIGRATAAIAAGEHIHLHNLASDYIPTWQPT
jgi:hypothetical protein